MKSLSIVIQISMLRALAASSLFHFTSPVQQTRTTATTNHHKITIPTQSDSHLLFSKPMNTINEPKTKLNERNKANEITNIKKKSKNILLLGFVTTSFLLLSLFCNTLGNYASDSLLQQDQQSFILTTILAFIFVKGCSYATSKNILNPKDSRKIIHSFSAPLYIVLWPLFSTGIGAKYFAALIPLTNMLRLYLAGSGNEDENELAMAVSRSGNLAEALEGPLIYVVIMLLTTLLFFKDSLTGVFAMIVMAMGDGFADLIGRRFGKSNKWFFSADKSIAGTAAFILASFLSCLAVSSWLDFTGAIPLPIPFGEFMIKTAVICLISAIVELLPFGNDNWNVPITAGALAQLLLK